MSLTPYSKTVLQFFQRITHGGELAGEHVFSATNGLADNGAVLSFYFECNKKEIVTARFKAHGGVVLLALAEYLCSALEGKPIEHAFSINAEQLVKAMDLPKTDRHLAHFVCETARKAVEE